MCERQTFIIHLTKAAACFKRSNPLTYEKLDFHKVREYVSVAATDNQEYTQAGLKDAISIFKGSVKSQGETNFI